MARGDVGMSCISLHKKCFVKTSTPPASLAAHGYVLGEPQLDKVSLDEKRNLLGTDNQ